MKTKKSRYCQLPSPGNIAGRSSSITNAFFNSLIPIHEPTEEEVLDGLRILEIDPGDIRCAYCGEKSSEWDHLRPIIANQQPTGYITEIANLVPACGKCNQSKGNRNWRDWMLSSAPLSPLSRGISDVESRVDRLSLYAMWKPPTKIDFTAIVSAEVWKKHHTNWRSVLDLLQESQKLAKEIRETIERAPRHRNEVTGQVTYGAAPPIQESGDENGVLLEHEEVFARLKERLQKR